MLELLGRTQNESVLHWNQRIWRCVSNAHSSSRMSRIRASRYPASCCRGCAGGSSCSRTSTVHAGKSSSAETRTPSPVSAVTAEALPTLGLKFYQGKFQNESYFSWDVHLKSSKHCSTKRICFQMSWLWTFQKSSDAGFKLIRHFEKIREYNGSTLSGKSLMKTIFNHFH